MSSSIPIKREPPEFPKTADQILHALTLSPARPGCEPVSVPFDGNRRSTFAIDEDANGQTRKTPNRGDGSNELENISQDNFVSSCKAWEKWYSLKQREGQTVLNFTDYLQKLLTSLPRHESGEPSMIERFHRLRSSLRDPIKAILDAQIIQPTTYDDLVNVAMRIEEKETNLMGHTTVSRRKPLIPVAPSKPSKPIPSSYRPKPNHNGYIPPQRPGLAPDHRARNLGPTPSRVSKRSKRKNQDIGIPRHHGLPMNQMSTGDKGNKITCYNCGNPNHITSECHEGSSKFSGPLSFPVRSKVPEDRSMPNSHWYP